MTVSPRVATINPRAYLETAEIEEMPAAREGAVREGEASTPPVDLDKLPASVVSGTTLIDFSAVSSEPIRAGVSLAMLFASRVATKTAGDEDEWLASYTNSLGQLGFSLAGSSIVSSSFKKTDLAVHKAIIPFLTVAFGGVAAGPVILALLQNLQNVDQGSPWITLFDQQTRRFNARELHFAAVSSNGTDTSVRYAIARLNIAMTQTNILFFRLTSAEAKFESSTTTMSANNSLLAVMEPDLRAKLGVMSHSFIAAAEL